VRDLLVADDHLGDAGRIAEIDERDSSVITTTIDPAREGDGLTDVLCSQGACGVSAKHGGFLLIWEMVNPASLPGAVSVDSPAQPWVPLMKGRHALRP
jgi:hypothetical protein